MFGHPSKFQRVSRLGFVTAATSLTGGQPNFARCLAVSRAGILYTHFWGALAPNRILPGAKFTLRPAIQVFRSPILTSLLYDTRAVGVSKTTGRPSRSTLGVELFSFNDFSTTVIVLKASQFTVATISIRRSVVIAVWRLCSRAMSSN